MLCDKCRRRESYDIIGCHTETSQYGVSHECWLTQGREVCFASNMGGSGSCWACFPVEVVATFSELRWMLDGKFIVPADEYTKACDVCKLCDHDDGTVLRHRIIDDRHVAFSWRHEYIFIDVKGPKDHHKYLGRHLWLSRTRAEALLLDLPILVERGRESRKQAVLDDIVATDAKYHELLRELEAIR